MKSRLLLASTLLMVACGDDAGGSGQGGASTADGASTSSGQGGEDVSTTSSGPSTAGTGGAGTGGADVGCGDGVIDAGEACDDGEATAFCDADCTLPACGDGTMNAAAGEACDDAGESPTCDVDCTPAACGDAVLNTTAGEQCDEGGPSAGCSVRCQRTPCGDGVLDPGEDCDDGGESVECDLDCTFASCGDGLRNATRGEACDTRGNSASCDADCTEPACGDGFVNGATGETCDDANGDDGDACPGTCRQAVCGDGYRRVGVEECDDGDLDSGDGCSSACVGEVHAYVGAQIDAVQGFATFANLPTGPNPYVEAGMEFWIFGADASRYTGCNGDGAGYYMNGGSTNPIRIRRADGTRFGALEFVAADGYGNCTSFGYAEVYLGGDLRGAFDLDGMASTTVYGFWGEFDEVRVQFYNNANERNTHNLALYGAATIDRVTFGMRP